MYLGQGLSTTFGRITDIISTLSFLYYPIYGEGWTFQNHKMKKLFLLLVAASFAVVSCYDDARIWDELDKHNERLEYLEELCKDLNSDIVTLQTIVTSLDNNDYIVTASPLATGDGYTFVFKSGKSIVVYNGKDGVNGVSPTVSVMKDVDGKYYWTVNGEWLLVNGEKVQASAADGTDGVTPKFQIADGYWQVSYDNGKSWETLGKATGEDGKDGENGNTLFADMYFEDGYVCFVLNNDDNTVIRIPHTDSALNIQFADPTMKRICVLAYDGNNDGELSFEEAANVTDLGLLHKLMVSGITSFDEFKYFTKISSVPSSFFADTQLTKITLPISIISVGENAFNGCVNLVEIKLPDGLTNIGKNAFYNCSSLTSVDIPSGVKEICNSTFWGCSALTKVNLPESIETIGKNVFNGCENLETVELPEGIVSLNEVFSNSGITTITIPSTVTTIDNAFSSCQKLTTIYCKSSGLIYNSSKKPFYKVEDLSKITVYIPKGTKTTYKTWMTGVNLIEYDFQNNEPVVSGAVEVTITETTPTCVVFNGTTSKVSPDFLVRVLYSTEETIHEQTANIVETYQVDADGTLALEITGLLPDQTYYYVVSTKINGETTFSETSSFSTQPIDMDVNVTGNSISGTINLTSKDNGVDYGIEYCDGDNSSDLTVIQRYSAVKASTQSYTSREFSIVSPAIDCYIRSFYEINGTIIYGDVYEYNANRTYLKRCLITTYAGTNCPYCDVIQTVLPEFFETQPEYRHWFTMMSVYGYDRFGGGGAFADCPSELDRNILGSYPAYSIDNHEVYTHDYTTGITEIQKKINQHIPVGYDLGVAIDTECSNDKITANIKVTSKSSASLFLEVVVVEDKAYGMQQSVTTGSIRMYHPYVARKLLSESGRNDFGDPIILTKDVELTSSYSVDVDSKWKLENTYIYAIVMDANGMVHNVATCLIGSNIGYQYEE